MHIRERTEAEQVLRVLEDAVGNQCETELCIYGGYIRRCVFCIGFMWQQLCTVCEPCVSLKQLTSVIRLYASHSFGYNFLPLCFFSVCWVEVCGLLQQLGLVWCPYFHCSELRLLAFLTDVVS